MFSGSKMKKAVIILALVMISSFALAAIIFVGEYGNKGMTFIQGNIKPQNAIDVDEEKSEPIAAVKNINVKTSSDDINFIATESSDIKAHFHGYYSTNAKDYKPEFIVTLDGDRLNIEIKYKPHVALTFSSNLVLDIYLPKTFSGNLDVAVSSANVNIDEMNLQSFICKTSSGDLKAKLVNAKKAICRASSGRTTITGKFDDFNFSSSSGDFNSSGITAINASMSTSSGSINASVNADSIHASSTSGNIEMDSVNAKKSYFSTSSGSVTLNGTPGDIEGNSTSGDISLGYKEYMNNIKIGTSSGRTKITLPKTSQFALSYKTSSGDSKCDFPITISGEKVRNNLEGVVVSDRNFIKVTSSSGDLKILKAND